MPSDHPTSPTSSILPPQEEEKKDKKAEAESPPIQLAKTLDKNGWIYVLFGVGDGISNAASLLKYAHEVQDNSLDTLSDRLHGWLLTPLGIALAVVEVLLVAGLAIVGSYFEKVTKNNNNIFARFLARAWPYVRDSIKALKNAYKAVRSVLFIALIFGASFAVLPGLILPLGLSLGLLSLINRVLSRNMGYERKHMQDANNAIAEWNTATVSQRQEWLKKYNKLKHIIKKFNPNESLEEIANNLVISGEDKFKYIQDQSRGIHIFGYASAAYEGLVTGLYLYAGVYLLCMLIPTMAIVVNVFSLFYIAMAVARALYEEFDYQRMLNLTITNARWQLSIGNDEPRTVQAYKAEFFALKTVTYGSAIGEGVRNGLAVYSAITGCLFAVALFTPIHLIALLSAIGLGFVSLCGFVGYAVYQAYQIRLQNEQCNDENDTCFALWKLNVTEFSQLQTLCDGAMLRERASSKIRQATIENYKTIHFTKVEVESIKKTLASTADGKRISDKIVNGLAYREANAVPDVLELGRSAASGARNANKISSFLLNGLAEKGADGHYHDSPTAFILMALLAPIQALVFSAKALAKGLGRPSRDPASHAYPPERLSSCSSFGNLLTETQSPSTTAPQTPGVYSSPGGVAWPETPTTTAEPPPLGTPGGPRTRPITPMPSFNLGSSP